MTSLSHDLIRSAVHRGALLLDVHVPGWLDRIDLDRLDMHNGDRCIAAQAFGTQYAVAMRRLGLDLNNGAPALYGFNFSAPFPRFNAVEWTWLHEAWVAEVTGRRNDIKPKPAKVRKPRVRKPVYTLSAEVSTTYAAGQNVSVTRRGGNIVKVTTWSTGVPGSTRRH